MRHKRPTKYHHETVVTGTCSYQELKAKVTRDGIHVTVPALTGFDHDLAAAILKGALGTIARARRAYRRTYGRRAP